jgi:hypothetical protein
MIGDTHKIEDNEASLLSQNSDNTENTDVEVIKLKNYFQVNNSNTNSFNFNNFSNRGFNRFRQFGIDPAEINIIRVLFHTAHLAHGRESKFINKIR